MRDKDAFSGFHPIVNFLYFGLVLGLSMFVLHPAFVIIALFCSSIYYKTLSGGRSLLRFFRFAAPAIFLITLLNALFNHKGSTPLLFLPSGNPLTLESLAYGAVSSAMYAAVILWFGCASAVFTSDKFVYLFGRAIPSLSLLIAMTLRFIPKFRAQIKSIVEAQAAMGRRMPSRGFAARIKYASSCVSALASWAFENAVDTADSMRSRGYGLPGRTSYSIYTFSARDRRAVVWLSACGLYILSVCASGMISWSYFPDMGACASGAGGAAVALFYAAVCLTPVIIDAKEGRRCTSSRSTG